MRTIGITGLLSATYIVGRLSPSNPLHGHPAYTPSITLYRYLQTTERYVNELFFPMAHWKPLTAVILLLIGLAIALYARSRLMLFGWLFYVLTLLPVSFAELRRG